MKLLITILLSLSMAHSSSAIQRAKNELLPFTTDGCSKSPDASWVHCCKDHDVAYWQGGTKDDKLEADIELRSCIADIAGDLIAATYYRGVRIGGGPGSKSTYRWGYGWKYLRNYGELSSDELSQVDDLFPQNHRDYPVTPSTKTLEDTPSKSGDYCLDEVHNYFEENTLPGQEVPIIEKVSIITRKKNPNRKSRREYLVKVKGCEERYTFKFGKTTPYNCKSIRPIYLTQEYLKEVIAPQGQCR